MIRWTRCDINKVFMKLLKGRIIAGKILKKVKTEIRQNDSRPGLAVILIGDDEASKIYANLKKKAAGKVGINFYLYKFSERINEADIIRKINDLNVDKKASGIIVQLPLPKKFQTQKIIKAINPKKDADGFFGKNKLQPVFPRAIVKLIENNGQKLVGKKAVILTNSKIFGGAMANMLKQKKIKSEYLILKNKSLQYSSILKRTEKADILISAIGKPRFVKADMVKKGAIVIDGGITKRGKKVLGDVDFDSVKNKASYITPVPGGVGPVTIACLLENVYILSEKQSN